MAIRITDTEMVSDQCGERAYTRDGAVWHVTGHPGRCFDRNQAITAMTLAEALAANPPESDRIWWHIHAWRAELGLDDGKEDR
ncbi:MAG: hypothetical protein ACRDTM_10705 [Micromonosporaceae bacterium]